jgi:hypothetical protein
MTDRITKHVSAMKEYGRKPYLVTADAIPYGEKADYRYMMDTTWHKAQDNEQIVVQSVKKKPYQNSDYQTMEQGYDFPIFTFPRWNFNFQFDFPNTIYRIKPNPYPTEPTEPTDTQTQATGIRWIQCPTSVSASKTYTIIVKNSSITIRNLVSGRLNGTHTIYFPTSFELVKATSDAKGFSISNLIDKGSTTRITLSTSSTARGSYYLYASDGKNTIKIIISASAFDTTALYFTEDVYSIIKVIDFGEDVYEESVWREGFFHDTPYYDILDYDLGSYAGVVGRWGVIYEYDRAEIDYGPPPTGYEDQYVYYNFNDSDVWQSAEGSVLDSSGLSYTGNNIVGSFTIWDGSNYLTYSVNNGSVSLV